ncbi:MAG: TraI domain-containing protein [Methylococcaceae bacterium]|nr:TraI domain-containing protein [Methylococcaceae bacterium]
MLKCRFSKTPDPKPTNIPPITGALRRLTANELLITHTSILNKIEELAGVPREFYHRYYETALLNYANFVQQLPASENHHHSMLRGMLQRGLEVAVIALKLRRAYLLPHGATPEVIIQKQDLWTYAIFAAALCHDIAKPAVDQAVALYDAEGKSSQWIAWTGPIPESVKWYRTKFRLERVHRLHEKASLLLVGHILPKEGIEWLNDDLSAFSPWVACIGGDTDQAGAIGEIVGRADRESVARNLGGDADAQTFVSGAKPLPEKLLTGLRHLLTEGELPLNRNGAAGWLVGNDLWLVSKRAIDTLRAHLLAEGHSGIPNRNDRIFDELLQRRMLVPCNDRAIWRCIAKCDEWEHELTLIRLPAGKIWSDPESLPEPFCGEVIPVEVEGIVDDIQPAPAMNQPYTEANNLRSETSDRNWSELIPDVPDSGNIQSVDIEDDAESENRPIFQKTHTKSTTPDNLGRQFLNWLRENIRNGQLSVDAPGSRIHNIAEGVFLVSPAIFREFVETTRSELSWEKVQKRFLKLNLHVKTADGLNVHKRLVSGVVLHGIICNLGPDFFADGEILTVNYL